MFWYPKTLKCQIYKNNELIDLNKCNDSILENLADSISMHWKTPTNSAVWFDIEIYEKQYWFKKSKNSIEVVCYKSDPYSSSGRKQVDISKLYIDKMIGKKFKIKLENMEVAFVA